MDHYIYVSYPDRTEKFNICKNYGLDKDLQLGDKPIPRRIDIKDIEFRLQTLPIKVYCRWNYG